MHQFSQFESLYQQSSERSRQSGAGQQRRKVCVQLLSQKVSVPVCSQTEMNQTGQTEEAPGPPLFCSHSGHLGCQDKNKTEAFNGDEPRFSELQMLSGAHRGL